MSRRLRAWSGRPRRISARWCGRVRWCSLALRAGGAVDVFDRYVWTRAASPTGLPSKFFRVAIWLSFTKSDAMFYRIHWPKRCTKDTFWEAIWSSNRWSGEAQQVDGAVGRAGEEVGWRGGDTGDAASPTNAASGAPRAISQTITLPSSEPERTRPSGSAANTQTPSVCPVSTRLSPLVDPTAAGCRPKSWRERGRRAAPPIPRPPPCAP